VTMSAQDLAAVLQRAIDSWNRAELDAYLELYGPGVILHGVPPGIEGVRRMYAGVWRAYPGSQLTLEDVIVEGNRLACRYTWRATNARSGESVTVPGVTILHFRDGKCTERWDFEGSEANVS
jgi:predicted ester cyclase